MIQFTAQSQLYSEIPDESGNGSYAPERNRVVAVVAAISLTIRMDIARKTDGAHEAEVGLIKESQISGIERESGGSFRYHMWSRQDVRAPRGEVL